VGLTYSKPEKLTASDNLQGFDCGHDAINDWVHKHAVHAESAGTAVVYATKDNHGRVVGIYSLSMHSVARSEVKNRNLKRNSPTEIPAILLGMLGVDTQNQKVGLGALLLRDAIKRSINAARIIGARALIVEPVNNSAAEFYKKYGFKEFNANGKLYIPLH
jgi:ribosomal protein S18 acetylase RimI-like enzyme